MRKKGERSHDESGVLLPGADNTAMEAIEAGEGQKTGRLEALEYQIEQLTQKKADVLDAFFSRQITKDEMKLVNERYDRELDALRVRLDAAHFKEGSVYESKTL